MVIEKCTYYDHWNKQGYRVYTNASHVEISTQLKDGSLGTPVFVRKPEQDDWYDKKHHAIVDALRALEAAIEAVVAR